MTSKTGLNSPSRPHSKGRFRAAVLAGLLAGFAWPGTSVMAQDFGQVLAQVLVVDRERLFRDSAYGRSITALIQEEQTRLEAETRTIEAELEAEELALTQARATLSPEEFRTRADAFDGRVRVLRLDRDQAQDDLLRQIEDVQATFLEQVNPIMITMMRESGALVLLDRRAVLLSASSIDITDTVIARIDEAFSAEDAPLVDNVDTPPDQTDDDN